MPPYETPITCLSGQLPSDEPGDLRRRPVRDRELGSTLIPLANAVVLNRTRVDFLDQAVIFQP